MAEPGLFGSHSLNRAKGFSLGWEEEEEEGTTPYSLIWEWKVSMGVMALLSWSWQEDNPEVVKRIQILLVVCQPLSRKTGPERRSGRKKKKKKEEEEERKNIWQTETDDETRHMGNDAFLANEARWAN